MLSRAFNRMSRPKRVVRCLTNTISCSQTIRSFGQGFSALEVEFFRRVFQELDRNSDGRVRIDDLVNVLATTGLVMEPEQVRHIIDDSDLNKDGELEFREFMLCTAQLTHNGLSHEMLNKLVASGAVVPVEGIPGTLHERTFMMVKPGAFKRTTIFPEVIQRWSQRGYLLVGLKMMVPSRKLASIHYEEHLEKPFFPKLVEFLSSGPVIAMAWQGKHVITTSRKMLGATDPLEAAPGTIRGDFAVDKGRNVVHGSDGPDSAMREIKLWFQPDEIVPSNYMWDLVNNVYEESVL